MVSFSVGIRRHNLKERLESEQCGDRRARAGCGCVLLQIIRIPWRGLGRTILPSYRVFPGIVAMDIAAVI